MQQPEHPNLHKLLLPPKPEASPPPAPKTRGRGRKKKEPDPETEPEPTAYESAQDDLSNIGPVLLRSQTIHDDYVLVLRGDVAIPFHRADWAGSGDDSFITLYRKTADHWQITDVCIDDISTVSISLPADSLGAS